jgi:hypothetical protein
MEIPLPQGRVLTALTPLPLWGRVRVAAAHVW